MVGNCVILLSHCTTHSFEIIGRRLKVMLADHINSTAIRYNVSYKYNL